MSRSANTRSHPPSDRSAHLPLSAPNCSSRRPCNSLSRLPELTVAISPTQSGSKMRGLPPICVALGSDDHVVSGTRREVAVALIFVLPRFVPSGRGVVFFPVRDHVSPQVISLLPHHPDWTPPPRSFGAESDQGGDRAPLHWSRCGGCHVL